MSDYLVDLRRRTYGLTFNDSVRKLSDDENFYEPYALIKSFKLSVDN